MAGSTQRSGSRRLAAPPPPVSRQDSRRGLTSTSIRRINSANLEFSNLLGPLFTEGQQSVLGLLAALRDRCHQRLHHESLARVRFRNPGQCVNDREVRDRSIHGEFAGEIEAPGKSLAVSDEIMRYAQRLPLHSIV